MRNRKFGPTTGWAAMLVVLLAALGMSTALPVVAAAPGLAAPATAAALQDEADDGVPTQDILHMADGRVLKGRIIEETRTQITFEIVDEAVGLSVTRTIDKRDVLEIERDVPVAAPPSTDEPQRSTTGRDEEQSNRPRGLGEGDPDDESLPAFYVIPMKGQMGTDIHPEVYKGVVEDIKRVRPDIVIWRMNCADISEQQMDLMGEEVMIEELNDPERSLEFLLDEYRELVRMLHDELPRDIRQVMWVEDSLGISSLIALAWEEMYMAPRARLGGIRRLASRFEEIGDEDVKEKMLAATLGIVSGFLHRGGRGEYADILTEAMTRPERKLSATWRGREVVWSLDTNGEYIVNSSNEMTAEFRAKHAEDFAISRGTAESLDDLALLLGYREYRVLEGESHRIIKRYVEDWRRAFERSQTLLREYQEYRRWASGDQAVQWLGQAANNLRQIIAAMNRYAAVEIRFRVQYGATKFNLEMLEESIRDQIQRMRRGGRGGGGGGTGPRGPGGR